MEKVSVEKLEQMKEELVKLEGHIKVLKNNLEELKKNDFVMSYIYADHEYQTYLNKINILKKEIPYQEMLNCDHYFVINEINHGFDGHRSCTDKVVTCVKCGLTNKYINFHFEPYFSWNEEYIRMNEAYKQSSKTNVNHGYCDYDEIDFYKSEYKKFKEEYPNASDKDIEEHISLVKKMKEGKLC